MRSHFYQSIPLRSSVMVMKCARSRSSPTSSLRAHYIISKQTSLQTFSCNLTTLKLCSQKGNISHPHRDCNGTSRLALKRTTRCSGHWYPLHTRSCSQAPLQSQDANNNARTRNLANKNKKEIINISRSLRRRGNYFDRRRRAVSSIIHKTQACSTETFHRERRSQTPHTNGRRGRPPGSLNRRMPNQTGPSCKEKRQICSSKPSRYKITSRSRNSSPRCSRYSNRSVLSRQTSCTRDAAGAGIHRRTSSVCSDTKSQDMCYSNSSQWKRESLREADRKGCRRYQKHNSSKGELECCYPQERSSYQSPINFTHRKRQYLGAGMASGQNDSSRLKINSGNNRQNNHKRRTRSNLASSTKGNIETRGRNKNKRGQKHRSRRSSVQPHGRMMNRLLTCLIM